jgi:hypothetical protein
MSHAITNTNEPTWGDLKDNNEEQPRRPSNWPIFCDILEHRVSMRDYIIVVKVWYEPA